MAWADAEADSGSQALFFAPCWPGVSLSQSFEPLARHAEQLLMVNRGVSHSSLETGTAQSRVVYPVTVLP